MKNRPRSGSGSPPDLTDAAAAFAPASWNRPSAQWPWANSTAGRSSFWSRTGRYRLPVT